MLGSRGSRANVQHAHKGKAMKQWIGVISPVDPLCPRVYPVGGNAVKGSRELARRYATKQLALEAAFAASFEGEDVDAEEVDDDTE